MPADVLIVFLRALTLGNVKTRLAASLGPHAALSVYAAMLDDLSAHLSRTEDSFLIAPFVDSAGHTGAFPIAHIQRGATVFERMANAIEVILRGKPERVVLVGSDIPYLDSSAIRELFRALDSCEACIGPSADGGYYGIGFRRFAYRREIFVPKKKAPRDGARDVLARTEATLDEHGLSHARTRTLRDVDTVADLEALSSRDDFPQVCPTLFAQRDFYRRRSIIVDPAKEL